MLLQHLKVNTLLQQVVPHSSFGLQIFLSPLTKLCTGQAAQDTFI